MNSKNCLELKEIHQVVSLLEQFNETKTSPEEFLKEVVCTKKLFVESSKESIVNLFLRITSWQEFITAVLEKVRIPVNGRTVVLSYLILFYITNESDYFVECFWELLKSKLERNNFLRHFLRKFEGNYDEDGECLITTIQTVASTFYDVDYVKGVILQSIKERLLVIKEVGNKLEENMKRDQEERKRKSKFTVKSRLPGIEGSVRDSNNSSLETVNDSLSTKNAKFVSRKKRNERSNSQLSFLLHPKLLKMSSNSSLSPLEAISEGDASSEFSLEASLKRTMSKLPQLKVTLSSVLRHGAQINRRLSTATKLIETLSSGGALVDPTEITIIDDELKKIEFQKHLDDIQRKHLSGLLAHEEAKISKLCLYQTKQAHANAIKEAKRQLMQQIGQTRHKDREKSHQLVQRNVDAVQKVRRARENLMKVKQEQARHLDDKLCAERRKAALDEQTELERKIQLIKEIKDVEKANRDMRNNYSNAMKVDKEQTPRHGLLCEMSLSQLELALKHIKYGIQKKIELQKAEIKEKQWHQKNLICQTIDQIEKFSSLERKSKQQPSSVVKSTPDDIKRLQEKLMQTRKQVTCGKLSVTNASRLGFK